MKTREFFNEIKKVAEDATIENVFAYVVNPDKRFYQIVLHSAPNAEVEAMCFRNGYSIRKNVLHAIEYGKGMVAHDIWEVMPTNADEIEYVEE